MRPRVWEFSEARKTEALPISGQISWTYFLKGNAALGKNQRSSFSTRPGASICWLSTSERAESASKTRCKGLAGQLLAYITRLAHGACPAQRAALITELSALQTCFCLKTFHKIDTASGQQAFRPHYWKHTSSDFLGTNACISETVQKNIGLNTRKCNRHFTAFGFFPSLVQFHLLGLSQSHNTTNTGRSTR